MSNFEFISLKEKSVIVLEKINSSKISIYKYPLEDFNYDVLMIITKVYILDKIHEV
jgi:hypothetical protein